MNRKYTLRIAAVLITTIILLTISACAGFAPVAGTELPMDDYKKIGTVAAETTNWNWFFKMDANERIKALEELASVKAKQKFGDDIIIQTEEINGKWSPASLLMLFNTIGFVENSSITASVWRKIADEKPVNYAYRYIVVPEAEYSGAWGFMLVDYKTRAQLEEALYTSFDNGDLTGERFKQRLSKLPDTGKIFITLAREEITNAISRWFTFTCSWNGKTIFSKRGIEDIPYVYGTDKLWWNDMSYNVGPAWDGELLLQINDSYRNEVFNFKVIKERYIIED